MGIGKLNPSSQIGVAVTKINEIVDVINTANIDTITGLLNALKIKANNGDLASVEINNVVFGTESMLKPQGQRLKDYLLRMKQELLDAIGSGGGGGITPEELEDLLRDSEVIADIWDVIRKMQGPEWTEDHSIMYNYKRTVIESITPKNIYTEVIGDEAHVVFSYEDNPNISHFILQYWDETEGKWVNYNGTDGIVPK